MVLYGYDKEEIVMGSKKHIKRYAAVGALSLLALSGIAVYNSQHNVSAATASYKNVQESNPIATQRYTADPGVMVYNDEVYIYTTNDVLEYKNGAVSENTFSKVTTLNCYSSKDMVNWTDHGTIQVAGSNGAAKWAGCSWAPAAAHKTINGKEKFFLYFANNSNGIGVLVADSPTGPWTDPIGGPLVSRSTANCSGVTWLFDPAVFVDDDGNGYLYFGGGIPGTNYSNPKTARVVKLGSDMTSLAGSPVTIDAPYLFEDSGINKINGKYYYSYCSNWNVSGGMNNAAIEYMVSDSPMGPFTYAGEIMKNPGNYFGVYGNNHHSIFNFKGKYYMAYHARAVETKAIGKSLGYRSTQIDELTVNNGKINQLTPTMKGVSQVSYVNPYETQQAETMFIQAGLNVEGSGDTYLSDVSNGDYTGVKGVNFTDGMSSMSIKVKSTGSGSIEVRSGSATGTLLGTIKVSNTNGSFKDFSANMKNITGVNDIYFVMKGNFNVDSWKAVSTKGGSSAGSSSGSNSQTAKEKNLLTTYGETFTRQGTCINLYQLKDANTLAQVKKQYNSITLENEMKPDALLGKNPSLISVDEAKKLGYYIPDGMNEEYVPKIDFSKIDETLKICSENGIGVRAHTLVWHSQTPDWLFRIGYSTKYNYVTSQQMDKRLEYYVKTVMNHVCLSEYGSCVYAWDVTNEYLHATDSSWEKVYGKGGTSPEFVKKAFTYAHQCLEYFKLTDSVSLFYNDYNTYMEVDDVIALVNFINSSGKVCDGVGMQSHLGTNYPSVDYYTAALKSFLNAGFEVQITELDVTNKSDADQADYMYKLMKNVCELKKNGANITGVTYWGLSDKVTWINNATPLIFSDLGTPKEAYNKVLQAYTDVFGWNDNSGSGSSTDQGNTGNTGNQGNTGSNTGSSVTQATLSDGWYYIKNTNAQKYLQVKDNKGSNGANVEIGTGTGVAGQKWYLTNKGNGYFTLKNATGYMLDIVYGKDEDGTNIQLYQDNSADAQQFKAVATKQNGVYGIVTKVSKDKKSLDVYNFGTSDGSNVCQWTYYENTCQTWVFEPTDYNTGNSNNSNTNNNTNGNTNTSDKNNTTTDKNNNQTTEADKGNTGNEIVVSMNGSSLDLTKVTGKQITGLKVTFSAKGSGNGSAHCRTTNGDWLGTGDYSFENSDTVTIDLSKMSNIGVIDLYSWWNSSGASIKEVKVIVK